MIFWFQIHTNDQHIKTPNTMKNKYCFRTRDFHKIDNLLNNYKRTHFKQMITKNVYLENF